MAEFYPSEIARLVLGYLKETKCLQSWEVFLEECTDLQEHKRLYRDGKFCTTNVNEKSLLDILSEYCVLKNASKESSQNQSATNTYQVYGVYKTPSKNESSYASYSINQRIQTRSVVKSGVKSPRYNLFRSPTSRPSCQTARRKLECQATTLNFGPEAQTPSENNISNNSANQSKQFLFISASSSTQTCSNSPQVSKDNLCLSSPGAPTCSNNQDRRDGSYSDPIRSKNVARTNSEKDHFFSPYQSHTAEVCSPQVINVSESGLREKCDTPDGTHTNISELKVDKQKSSTTVMCNTAITQSSVKTAVSQSSEITASTETIALSLSENCSTPQYEADPPPYNRAPDTNSPRIVLSHDRSLIPSLTTPNKDKKSWPEEEWSPKRKGTIPRRRLITESPVSKYIQQPETLITFDSVIENLFGPDEALFNDPLVQLLTENINKVKQCELKESDIEGLDDLVKKAAESTGEDPAFERFLNQMCTNNKNGEHFNIESTPSKLPEIDYEMVSDENKNNQKEIIDKTVNDDLNQETTQNFHNGTELEHTKNPTADETGHSNNESVITLENNLEPSVTDSDINHSISLGPQQVLDSVSSAQLNSDINHSISPGPQQVLDSVGSAQLNSDINHSISPDPQQVLDSVGSAQLNSDINHSISPGPQQVLDSVSSAQLNSDINHSISPGPQQVLDSVSSAQLSSTPENISPEEKTGESEIVNKPKDLTSNLSANGNSDKDLQSAKASSVTSMVNDTSGIRTAVKNMLNDTSLNNSKKVKKAEISTEGNQNISVNVHNAPQTNNSCSANSQPVSNIQRTGPNPSVVQVVSQPPQIAPPQPNALLKLTVDTVPAILLSTLGPDGTVQSNLYRFVMNPPVFNPSPIGGIGLPLPTISTQNVGSPLIVTSAPTVPLLNVENIGNNKTFPKTAEKPIATPESSKSLILDIRSSDKEITPNKVTPNESSTPPKKLKSEEFTCILELLPGLGKQKAGQRTSKRQKTKKSVCEKLVSSPSSSVPKKSKRKSTRKSSKRKPLCLFPDSPSSKTNKIVFQTPVKDSENEIPVLSIPEPSPSNQSSAFKYLSQITGQFERGDRSPVLKSLMSQAAVLSDKKSRCTSSYVRCLDFSPDSNKINDSVNVIMNNKTVKPALGKSNAVSRRSSRIQRRKAEMLKDSKIVKSINVQQLKRKLNVDSVAVSSPTDHVKNIESDNFNSPLFNKALDVLNCIDAAPVFDDDIDLEQIAPKENSHIVANVSSSDLLPSNQTVEAKKLEERQQNEIEVIDLNESDNNVNLKDNISVLSPSPEKNISSVSNLNQQHPQLRKKQKVKNIDKNFENNVNLKENKDNNTSKRSPLQHKYTVPSTVKSSSSFVPLPKCTNSEFFAKNSNDKSKESTSIINDSKNVKIVNKSIKSPESNKSNCTRLDLLLFGSDNEFTPEKDSNSCIQATKVAVSSSSVICTSTATHITEQNEINQPTAETPIHTPKNQNISPKVLSSLDSKQSPRSNNDKLSFSNTVNSHLEEKLCNLIDKTYESAPSLSSDNCPAINTSKSIQQGKKTKILNENTKKSELLTSLKVATTVQNADLADIEKESYSVVEKSNVPCIESAAVIKNRPVFKSKTPQKKSLESIVSYCKEKESAECQRVSKTPCKEGVTNEFDNFKKTLAEISLQSDSKISPINNTNAHKSKDSIDCTQMINKDKSARKKSINNASRPPSTMQKSPDIQKKSPENTPSHFIQRTKSVSPCEQSMDMSKLNEHSLSVLNNSKPSSENQINHFVCNKNQQLDNFSELVNQNVKASLHNRKTVVESSLAASSTNNGILSKKNIFSETDVLQSNNSSENSKLANTETDKALPPPKKRIRPIPVDSSSSESFSSPFKRILSSPNVSMSAYTVPAENAAKKQVFIQSPLNVCEPLCSIKLKEKSIETNDASITDFVPVCITDTSNLNDQSSVAKSSVTSFISPLKQSTSVLETKSPSLSIKNKSISCSPKSMSPSPTFKQPFIWRSGKPRAMLEIYKNAFPNKNSELPISPLSFSNSSSTFDALPAKRKLLEDSLSESSKEIPPSESPKEVQKSVNGQENCDFNTDLSRNKKHTVQQKMVKENNALDRQEPDNETCKTLRTYSRLRHAKKNASKISSDKTFDNGDDDDNEDPFDKERKRKKSDSSCSDDCSTVIDFECDIMTPVKSDDWLKKDLFRKSPARSSEKSDKPRPTSVSSYESDVSPEKVDYINNETGLSPYKLKEINVMDIPLNSSTMNKLSQSLIENSSVNVTNTKLDTNVMDSSLNVYISNIDEGIHEPDSVSTNVPKVSTSAEKVEKHNEFENTCSHSKKRKVSSDKKERRSRPTLKIASLNSPSKKKDSDKKQDISPSSSNSKKSSIKTKVKKKTSPNVVPINSEPREKSDKKNIRTSSRSHINDAKCTRDQNANLKKEVTERNENSLDQATKTVSEKVIKSCTAATQNSVISPKKILGSLDHYETTQDIVESDIGRSSDAGSELSIAIASCERELLNSQGDNCSQSPRHHPDFQFSTPRKPPSNNQQAQHASPPKMDADGSKLSLIMDKINLLSPEKLNILLEKIMGKE